MAHTYVIFDGDKDQWAYRYLRGWNALENVDFEFEDAHDIGNMTARASDRDYVRAQLKKRMLNADKVIVIVGESTKYLRNFVCWEIELAAELDLPIVVVNLNGLRRMDEDLCPVALRTGYYVHVPFKLAIIKHALDHYPTEYRRRAPGSGGWRLYNDTVYEQLGL